MSVLNAALRRGELEKDERYLTSPEGAPLRFQLAGRGERAGALLIDLCIVIAAFVALLLLLGYVADTVGGVDFGFVFFSIFSQLLFFAMRWGYFIAFEMTPRAATPGKRALKLRVVNRDGGPLTPEAVIARNLTREVEIFFPVIALLGIGSDGWAGLFTAIWLCALLALPFCNRDRMRGGDFIAGTWVVHTPKPVLATDQAAAPRPLGGRVYSFTSAQLDLYGEYELQVLEGVLRDETQGRTELLRDVSEAVARKIGWPSDIRVAEREGFLTAFYAAQRERLEARRRAGQIRADKTG